MCMTPFPFCPVEPARMIAVYRSCLIHEIPKPEYVYIRGYDSENGIGNSDEFNGVCSDCIIEDII